MTWHPIRFGRRGIVSAGIPAGMHGPFESGTGGVALLNHRLHAGMPPAYLSEDQKKFEASTEDLGLYFYSESN